MEPIFFWSRQFTRGRKKKRENCKVEYMEEKLASSGDHVQPQQPKTTWIVTRILISLFLFLPDSQSAMRCLKRITQTIEKRIVGCHRPFFFIIKKRSSDAVCFLVTFFCYNNQVGLVDKFELERMCWEEKWNYNFARTSNVNLVMNSELQ
jgi:hypothetical protein